MSKEILFTLTLKEMVLIHSSIMVEVTAIGVGVVVVVEVVYVVAVEEDFKVKIERKRKTKRANPVKRQSLKPLETRLIS